jgi:leucyl/phenylalanyl-tRNA---protein transferase
MPVFRLDSTNRFPNPELADKTGLLAIGGDLSPNRLLSAYSVGAFPWYSNGEPILWWSPDPRLILIPDQLKISKTLKSTIRNKGFDVKFDTKFEEVIFRCARVKRSDGDGTWITDDMIKAYIHLYYLGFAHSVETYYKNELVGGLYGVSLGKAFFGESMFFKMRDASKVALVQLVNKLAEWEFHFIDAQLETPHLISMGGSLIPRKEFLERLKDALIYPDIKGKW